MGFIEIDCPQGSKEWHLARAGCLTASRAVTLMTGSPESKNRLAYELNGELMKAEMGIAGSNFTSEAMEWGKANESKARHIYSWDVCDVQEVGFLLHDKYNRVGCSPDGINRYSDGRIISGVEIKCPFNPEMHAKHLAGLISPAYYWQIQFCIWVSGAQFWDFMSYDFKWESHSKYIKSQSTYYKRFMREESIMRQIESAVVEFVGVRDSLGSYKPKATASELLVSGSIPNFNKLIGA